MDIGAVLTRAWKIIWKHKVLWIFGILAGCSGGNARNTSSWTTSSSNGNTWGEGFTPVERFFADLPDWQMAAIVIGILLVVLIFIVIAVFLGTIGRIGLIRGTQQVEQGAEKLLFGELFSGSMPYFWRVFLLNLVVGLGVGLTAAFIAVLVVLGSILTLGIGLICIIPLLCIAVPIGWAVGILVQQASIAIVIENLGITEGLRRSWELIKKNVATYILMWLVLVLGIGLIGGIIIGLPLVFVAAPALGGLLFGTQETLNSALIIAGVCLAGYLPVVIVLSGILTSFTDTAWTLTFMRISGTPASIATVETAPQPTN